MSTDNRTVLALVSDLMFTVRIGEAAKRAQVALKFVKDSNDLLAHRNQADLVILDLNNTQTDAIGAIKQLKSLEETNSIRIVGFVSHVQGDLIRAAREAGCDEILARSAFFSSLPEILSGAESK